MENTSTGHVCQGLATFLILICYFLDYEKVSYQMSPDYTLEFTISFIGRETINFNGEKESIYLGGNCEDSTLCHLFVVDPYIYGVVILISIIGMVCRSQAQSSSLKKSLFITVISAFTCILMPSLILGQLQDKQGLVLITLLLQYFAGGLYMSATVIDWKLLSMLEN